VIYLNVSDKNEEFLFDSITLDYDFSTTSPIFFLNIYSLEGIINQENPSEYIEFNNKFVNMCPILNKTNFIVNNNRNGLNHTLKEIICVPLCPYPEFVI
jgi:hypothetical protein